MVLILENLPPIEESFNLKGDNSCTLCAFNNIALETLVEDFKFHDLFHAVSESFRVSQTFSQVSRFLVFVSPRGKGISPTCT